MRGFLLDTSCISELLSPKPEPRVIEWMEAAGEESLHLSAVTLGEIRKGAAGLVQGRRRTRLETWLSLDLPARFHGRIWPVDAAVADRWGRMASEARAQGKVLPVIDGLIAATAAQNDLTLVSRNAGDFAGTGVAFLNPWVR